MPELKLYENFKRGDEDFPVELIRTHMLVRDFFIPLHWHEQLEIQYIMDGEGIISSNQVNYHVEPGDVLIVNSLEVHQGFCTLPTLDAYVLVFNIGEFIGELAEKPIMFQSLIKNDKTMQELFADIFNEDARKEFGYKSAMKGKFYELLVYLMRNYTVDSTSLRHSLPQSQELDRLNPVMDYIDKNYTNAMITIKDLAKLVNLSTGRFSHLFKSITGISPGAYLNQHRIQQAYRLLQKGKMTNTEIAYSVGFSDYNNFINQFKKIYHLTPTQIRKRKKD